MKTFWSTLVLILSVCLGPGAALAGAPQDLAVAEVPLQQLEALAPLEPLEGLAPLEPLGTLAAQEPEVETGGEAEPTPDNPGDAEDALDGPGPVLVSTSEVVRFGGDYTLPAGESVREVVIISGSATIGGEVLRDVVVIVGRVELASTAVIGGDLVVMGGNATIAPGAVIDGDLVVFGDEVTLPPGFEPGGEQVLAETFGFGTGFLEFVPFVTRGLFWGRLIVPDLAWIWGVVAIFLAVYLGLNLVFDSATHACSGKISERPLSTLLAGLLALLLVGPVAFLLTVSVVGLIVVPFVFCAFVVAGVIGKVGVLRWMGSGILRQDTTDSRALSALAVVVGFGLVALAYMVPVLGILTWATLGSLGLGAAAIAFVSALRTENPAPSPPPPPPPLASRPDPAVGTGGPEGETPPAENAGGAGVQGGAAGAGFVASGSSRAGTTDAPPASLDAALFPRASFLIRLGAFALDFFLVGMTFGLLGLDNGGRFLVLFLVYNIGFWSWKGATVGGIICQFRVVRVDGQPLTFSDALVRGLSSIFSFAALGLGCLWVLWDGERQAWHDKIAATYVVRVPRNWPVS